MQVEVGNNINRSGDNNAQLSNAIQLPVSQSAVVRQQQQQLQQQQQQQMSLQSKESSSSSADYFSVSSDLQKLVGAFGGVKSIDLCKEFMKTIWTAKESSFKLQAFQIINRTNNRSILQKLVEFRLAELLRVWLRDAIKNDFLDFVNVALDVSRKLPVNTEQVKEIGKVVKVSLSKHENLAIRDKAQDLLSYWLSVAAKSSSSSQTLQSQQQEEQQVSAGIGRGEGKAAQSKVSVSTTSSSSSSSALASPNSPTEVKGKVASAKYNDVDIFNTLDILEPRKKPKLMSGNVPQSKQVGSENVNQSAGSSSAQQQSQSQSQTGSNAQKGAVPAVPYKPKKTVRWKPDSQLCTIHEIERIDYYGGKAAQSSLKDMDKSEGSAIKRGFVDDGGDSSAPQGGDIKSNSGEQVTFQVGNNPVQAASGVDVSSLLTTITGNSQFKDILSQFIPPSSSQNQQATAAVYPQTMQPQYQESMHPQGSQIYNGTPSVSQHVQPQYPNVAAASANVYGYQYPQVGQYNQFGNGLAAQPFVMQQQQMLQQQPQQQQPQQLMYQQNYHHHHHQPNQQPQSQQSVDQAAFQLPPELIQNLTTILQTVGTVTDGQKSTSGVVNAQSGQSQQHQHHQKRRDGKAQSGQKNKNAKKQKQQQQ
ncbi:hypothetical protein MIR68_011223 [Amoeboaphelidium protococcarum]|nr:hypothetical protein MIR68_011223 [Amoeboaphelidium protococcarum]